MNKCSLCEVDDEIGKSVNLSIILLILVLFLNELYVSRKAGGNLYSIV